MEPMGTDMRELSEERILECSRLATTAGTIGFDRGSERERRRQETARQDVDCFYHDHRFISSAQGARSLGNQDETREASV